MTDNFLDLDGEHCAYDDARFAILPIPYDGAASYMRGARNGPAAIIAASHHVEWFDEELGVECHGRGIATLDAVNGDRASHAVLEEVFTAAERVVGDGKFLLGLGGDHSVSSALIRAVMTKHKKLSILQLDAHCDLRDSYDGSPHSHACVMRRAVEMGADITPVGIRSVDLAERDFMINAGITPITARACHTNTTWIDDALAGLGEMVYVTLDIDAFDPAYAPGTGTPEPGGLDWYQVTALLRRVARERNIIAADVVEVMPIPGQVVTEFLAAKLAYKMIAYVGDKT